MPTETDEHGNVNNVIRVGDIARIRPAPTQLQIKVRTNQELYYPNYLTLFIKSCQKFADLLIFLVCRIT